MQTRRHVLELLAAAPVLASCGGGALPDPVAAWRDPGAGQTDPRRYALAHAILTPNPHNTQPWLVELDDANGMTLFCDLDRRLAATDPLDRQITMGCGGFLELYRIAAAELGHVAEIIPFPDGEPTPRLDARPLAHVRFSPLANAARDPLFAQIIARRTNRNDYDPARAPSEDALSAIASQARQNTLLEGEALWTAEPARVTQLRDLVWRGFERELQTRAAQIETYGWLRFGRDDIARRPDGLALEGAMIAPLKALGFFDLDDFLNQNSLANTEAAKQWRTKAATAPAFMWLISQDDAPTSRLTTGMAYARLNLAATAAGVAMHPWSQVLQEYPEMRDLYNEARTTLDVGERTLQMLVRVGYAEPVHPAARRGVEPILRA